MRQNLYVTGSAVEKLRGNVEHALKVVAGTDIMDQLPQGTFQPTPIAPYTGPSRVISDASGRYAAQPAVNGSLVMPPANPTVGVRVVPHLPSPVVSGGCWQYQSIDGVPLVMDRVYPYANPNLGRPAPACSARPCPAAPAVPGYGSLAEWELNQHAPRRGVLREDHVPVGPEPDQRIAWQSGFMPVDTSFVRQVIPPWVSAYGRLPFNCGPCPNVGGVPATVGGSPVVRSTNGQILVG